MVKIRDVMNHRVVKLTPESTMLYAAEMFCLSQASDLMVVDGSNRFIGVVSEGDLIRAVLPDIKEAVHSGMTQNDLYRIFLESGKGLANQSVARLIIENPITVRPDSELLEAATVMTGKQIRRLPVVEDGRFLGTVSRADICWGLLGTAVAPTL